jgi:aminocarboxymuconate-semialdehyde decarboxylase
MTSVPMPTREQESRAAIDIHAHLIPRMVVRKLSRAQRGFPNIQIHPRGAGSYSFQFGPDLPSPVPPPLIFDIEARAEWIEAQGLTCQIVSPWTDLFGYGLPSAEARDWCRLLNDEMLEATRERIELETLGAIPLQDPGAAIPELERVAEAGCCGVMIGTSTPERELDDPVLDEVWAAAAELEMPVFIHPIRPQGDSRGWAGELSNTVGRLRESLLALARLLMSGVPVRHPNLRLIFAHGGAGPETLLARLRRQHAVRVDGAPDPAISFRRLYFDSVVIEPRILKGLIEEVDAGHVLLGSDYPFFWEPSPRETVEHAGLDDGSEVAVLAGNAQQLFRLVSSPPRLGRPSVIVGGDR